MGRDNNKIDLISSWEKNKYNFQLDKNYVKCEHCGKLIKKVDAYDIGGNGDTEYICKECFNETENNNIIEFPCRCLAIECNNNSIKFDRILDCPEDLMDIQCFYGDQENLSNTCLFYYGKEANKKIKELKGYKE